MFQVEHEEWFVAHKFYQEQFSSTLRAWAHDRQDLLIKVKVTFIDAWTAYEEATEKAKTRKKQEHICQELYKKVGPGQFFGISFEFSVEILQNNDGHVVLGSDACRKTLGSQVQFSLYYQYF